MKATSILGLVALAQAGVVVLPREEMDSRLPPLQPHSAEKLEELKGAIIPQKIEWSAQDLSRFRMPGQAEPFVPEGLPVVNQTADRLESRSIYGNDDRYIEWQTVYPFTTMGRIQINYPNAGTWCSGSLVGNRVVATARHCLGSGASYSFSPAYYNGDRMPTANVIATVSLPGTIGDGCSWADDWALLILDRGLGGSSGYLGAKDWDNALTRQNIWSSYGYPQDKSGSGQVPYAQHGFPAWWNGDCPNGGGPIEHLADLYPGQSGSAIYRNENGSPYQVSVLVGGSTSNGIGARGRSFIDSIIRCRNDFP